MNRFLFCAYAAAFILFSLVVGASPGGDKAAPWKPFLPEDAHGVLAMRSMTAVAEAGKAGNKERAEVEEAISAGYVLSVERKSGELKESARQDEIAKIRGKMQRKEIFVEMMETFRNRTKQRVDGIHADLQYQPKLKNQNSIEALIGALATKKLSEENLAKVEKELPLLSYRIAVMANLSQHAAPAKDTERWIKLASDMRDSAISLAKAATKKDANGIFKAADALQDSCINCHREFKAK
jgi:cytochrome c556